MYKHFTERSLHTRSNLGQKVREVIPLCVVLWILQAFPDPAGQYVGFPLD
jgi:hypothetical protein